MVQIVGDNSLEEPYPRTQICRKSFPFGDVDTTEYKQLMTARYCADTPMVPPSKVPMLVAGSNQQDDWLASQPTIKHSLSGEATIQLTSSSREMSCTMPSIDCNRPSHPPVGGMSRNNSIPLKMPTPLRHSDHNSTNTTAPEDRARQPEIDAWSSCPEMMISAEDIGSRFAAFLQDDRNIRLCQAIEKYWLESGMQR